MGTGHVPMRMYRSEASMLDIKKLNTILSQAKFLM